MAHPPISKVVAVCLLLFFAAIASAQSQPATPAAKPSQQEPASNTERAHALELYHAGRLVDAKPILEKLAVANPSDAGVKEALAFCILGFSATLSDPAQRVEARKRAREVALEAKQLGDDSNLLQVVLSVPEDGSEPAFSDKKEVDAAMKSAEADFARGDLEKARHGYLQVLQLDPNNYEATLFIGDTYFKQHSPSCGEWFARAIEIEPNRETAYRYWGDALWQTGKNPEAREKYIQAVVADPYNHNSTMGLTQWIQRMNLQAKWLRIQDKAKIVSTETGVQVTLDPSLHPEDPMYEPWLVYAGRRVEWQKGKFKQHFPNEPKYRHTLAEEVDALHLMVVALLQPKLAGKADPSLAALIQIDQSGFLEPFVLLNRADDDIAEDYPAYRTAHRDKLYRYFDEYVVPKAPTSAPSPAQP